MVRGVPCFLTLEGPLIHEELLAPVEPWEGILLVVVHGEGKLERADFHYRESAWHRSQWLDLRFGLLLAEELVI